MALTPASALLLLGVLGVDIGAVQLGVLLEELRVAVALRHRLPRLRDQLADALFDLNKDLAGAAHRWLLSTRRWWCSASTTSSWRRSSPSPFPRSYNPACEQASSHCRCNWVIRSL